MGMRAESQVVLSDFWLASIMTGCCSGGGRICEGKEQEREWKRKKMVRRRRVSMRERDRERGREKDMVGDILYIKKRKLIS